MYKNDKQRITMTIPVTKHSRDGEAFPDNAGQDSTTHETHYKLATDQIDDTRKKTAGFIIDVWPNSTPRRDRLHPVYGDFPLIRPGAGIPPKPELLQHVDDQVYLSFMESLLGLLKRDHQMLSVLSAVFLVAILLLVFAGDDDTYFYVSISIMVLIMLAACYSDYQKPDAVEDFYESFQTYGILVEKVPYYSEFYVTRGFGSKYVRSRRDRSNYVVFSEQTSKREILRGEKQWDFIKIV